MLPLTRPLPFINTLLMLVLCASSMAQTTRITGTVSDAKSGEPLPFVNIAFVNSRIGTTSDIDGRFMLETFYATDSIRASFIHSRK